MPKGYGRISVRGKQRYTHRMAYAITFGDIDEGVCVLHRCDTPSCICPDHLWQGDHAANVRDAAEKGHISAGQLKRSERFPESYPRGDRHHSHTNPETMPRGESHGNAKLSDDTIRQIRALYKRGSVGYVQVGQRFGIHAMTVKAIVTRKSWAHVP